jgi:hypothetical protein
LSADRAFFLLFRSIHDVLRAEKALKKTAAIFELAPVPRQISSECGVCIKSAESLRDLFRTTGAPDPDRCYIYDGRDYVLMETEP